MLVTCEALSIYPHKLMTNTLSRPFLNMFCQDKTTDSSSLQCASALFWVPHLFFFFFWHLLLKEVTRAALLAAVPLTLHSPYTPLHWALVLTSFLFTKTLDVSLPPPPQKPICPVKISQEFKVVQHDNYRHTLNPP